MSAPRLPEYLHRCPRGFDPLSAHRSRAVDDEDELGGGSWSGGWLAEPAWSTRVSARVAIAALGDSPPRGQRRCPTQRGSCARERGVGEGARHDEDGRCERIDSCTAASCGSSSALSPDVGTRTRRDGNLKRMDNEAQVGVSVRVEPLERETGERVNYSRAYSSVPG